MDENYLENEDEYDLRLNEDRVSPEQTQVLYRIAFSLNYRKNILREYNIK